MKRVFILIPAILFAVACADESDLAKELSEQDHEALEHMEEAYETALLYNDSLAWCHDNANQCDSSFKLYCDSIYHHYDMEFDEHHEQYSHDNEDDDHHHGATSHHHHGDMDHDDDDHHDDHHGHSTESHGLMENLRTNHQMYHPE